MKGKKKPLGTKAEIRALKERERRIAAAILLAIILFTIALSAYFAYTILSPSTSFSFVEPTLQFKPENANPEFRAAIVDQVSLTYPNQAFVETAANTLKQAGYTVDYYAGENVTVEFYRNLPAYGYRLIILRVHAAGTPVIGSAELVLFTSEPYSETKYALEQLKQQVGGVADSAGSPIYFGISPNFVRECMKNRFINATIIMMGCDGLKGTEMAKAFIEKGADVYIGWNDSVSTGQTDQATTVLLQRLILGKHTIGLAVKDVMKEVGPDLAYNSQLTYYPAEAEEQTIENIGKS